LSARQRHLLQVQATDLFLGRVVRKLKAIDAYDESTIVLTADHGVAFTAGHSLRGASKETYPQIMWAPTLIKAPGQREAVVDDRPMLNIDLFPTLTEMLGVKVPWEVDGRSALGTPREDGPRKLFEWNLNQEQPPPGSKYLTYDGPAGFAAAMRGQASADTGDPGLRLYRIGEFGGLVGQPAAPLVKAVDKSGTVFVRSKQVFHSVDPDAAIAPWLYVLGRAGPTIPPDRTLAIAVNGTIAGVAQTFGPEEERPKFWSSLWPEAFKRDFNDVRVYAVGGTPTAPELTELKLRVDRTITAGNRPPIQP
jgi:hypothetical protein